MKLSDELHNRIAILLLPFVQTHEARQELMSASWGPDEPLIGYIDISGAPRPFADRFVYRTSQYRRQSGEPAIEAVLEQLYKQVGAGQQAEIDDILSWWQRYPHLLGVSAPYKGLEAYEEGDAGYFYGRAGLIAKLLERMADWELDSQTMRFLAIVGASGSGKSSLVRAGLIPKLREMKRWQVIVIRPGVDALSSLAIPLLTQTENSTTPVSQLVGELLAAKETLDTILKQRLAHEWAAYSGILLVVDQFEELFTTESPDFHRPSAKAARTAFVNNLLCAASVPAGSLRLIITLRADFYHRCAEYEGLRTALSNHQEYIGAMAVEELQEVIERPSEVAGYRLQAGLTEVILDDLGAADGRPEPGFLPLLSHALLQTWQQRQGFTLTLEDYQAAGGVKGALRATAERVYTTLTTEEQALAHRLFIALTEMHEGSEDTRRRVFRSELEALTSDQELLGRVVRKLTQARLVITDQRIEADLTEVARADFSYVEVTHEALIREWPRLRSWLDEDRVRLQLHRLLTSAAQEWASHHQDDGYLYRGTRLQQVKSWATGQNNELGTREQAFLRASIRHERALRWQRVGGVLAFLLLVIVGAFFTGITIQRAQWRSQALAMSELVEVKVPGQTITACLPLAERVICSEINPNAVPIAVEPFAVEKYEVSNVQYLLCRKANACATDPDSERYGQDAYQYFPVQGVNAIQASEYCRWIGRQLPTELQWELALGESSLEFVDFHDLSPVREPLHLTAAGVVNLLGNVTEWTRSYAQSDTSRYEEVLWDGLAEDLDFGLFLVVRGDSWLDSATRGEASGRLTDESFGFRCVTQLD